MLTEQIYVMSAVSPFREAKDVWRKLIDQLRLFRQGDGWPDKQELKKLKDNSHPSPQQHYQFHKAALGLPIVFHFPSQKRGREEVEFMLLGKEAGHDRLASSLILRPFACQNKHFVGLVILLENYPVGPENVQIQKKVSEEWEEVPVTIETGEKDIIKDFIPYLEKGKFEHNTKNNAYSKKNYRQRNNNKRGNTR